MKTVQFQEKTYAVEPGLVQSPVIDVSSLGSSEQVTLYNLLASNLGERGVKKFSDKKTGTRRVVEKLVAWDSFDENAPKAEKPTKKPKKPKAAAKPKGERKKRGMRFVFPVADEIKSVREGTSRAVLVEMLKKGATFEECMAATWGKRKDMDAATKVKTTYEGIRLLHYYCGYGMSQDEKTGVIKLKG